MNMVEALPKTAFNPTKASLPDACLEKKKNSEHTAVPSATSQQSNPAFSTGKTRTESAKEAVSKDSRSAPLSNPINSTISVSRVAAGIARSQKLMAEIMEQQTGAGLDEESLKEGGRGPS